MDLINIIVFISAIINLFLGAFILKKGNNKLINRSYGLLALSLFFWAVAKIIYRAAPNVELSILYDRILYIVPIFVVLSVLYFTYIFPEGEKPKNKLLMPLLIIISLIASAAVIFTDYVIKDIILHVGREKEMVYGRFYPFYSIYIAGFFAWSWIKMIKKMRNSAGLVRTQSSIVFLGIMIGSFLSMITNIVLLRIGIFKFVWGGHVLTLIMVVFIAYAIVKHRLMDIRVVMRSYSVYLVSLFSIILPTLIIKKIANDYAGGQIEWLDYVILILAIIFFPSLKNYYYRLANKYFFSSLYDDRRLIAMLSERLGSTLDIVKIYDYISKTLKRAFHTKFILFMAYDENSDEYIIRYRQGIKPLRPKSFLGDKNINEVLSRRQKAIVLEELEDWEYKRNKRVFDILKKWKIEVIVPLNMKNKITGMLLLSEKESRDVYNDTDLEVLEIISANASMAVENAMLYKKTLKFNVRLHEEVESATRELREANRKLKKLDQAKSEFVSIASHQLRTPLTVIKGYISMIIEESFGKLTPRQRSSLQRVFDSNERLIRLVENLLNISRIESGRLKFSYELTHLEDLVASVYEELKNQAQAKGLEFKFIAPPEHLPKLILDREKVRQVIMNLADNAIKYSEKGQVVIELSKTKEKIRFCVSDSGMGITKEDLPKLFTKFTRGTDTVLVHTEGTGLGLYVAKQMVEAHHGRIWAESPGPSKGAKFCFELPIA